MRWSLTVIAIVAACRTPTSLSPTPSLAARLDQQLTTAVTARPFVGITAAVGRCGQVAWTNAEGWASLKPRRKMRPDTPSRIGSVAKVLTAVAFMRLQAEGIVDLDRQLGRQVGLSLSLPASLQTIEPRQILNHSSGLRHY
ncbi:MAG: serine hydrolase domain-containing protein, partial [Myxococcota bacterium]